MKSKLQSGSRVSRLNKSGFTLVELLAVTLIMALLAGIVVGLSGYASRRASESQVKAELQLLRNALEEYRLNRGSYPPGNAQSRIATEAEWRDFQVTVSNISPRVAADLVFVDSWGEPYLYTNQSRFSFDLYSHGPSGPNEDHDRIR